MNIRSLTMRWLTCVLLLIGGLHAAKAQYVYKIKADTVRIYNTCDTAELVLQNRTQNVLGYLYNKGGGVTEFRALGVVDTIYRSNDTLFYHTADGKVIPVKIDLTAINDTRYDLKSTNYITVNPNDSANYGKIPVQKMVGVGAYNATDMPPLSNQAFQNPGSKAYYQGFAVSDGIRGVNMMVNWDGELKGPNGAFLRTKDDTKSTWSAWRELVFKDYADTAYNGHQNLGSVLLNGNAANTDIKLGDSTNTQAVRYLDYRNIYNTPVTGSYSIGMTGNSSGGAGIATVSGSGLSHSLVVPFNTNAPVFTSNGGASWDTIWHAGNHAKGNQFSQVFANGVVLSTLTTNASGHVTGLGVRTLTPADIGAAPASTSGKGFVENRDTTSTSQSGGFNMSGSGILGRLIVPAGPYGKPTFTTRSAGTKMVLYPNIAATTTDYALGIEAGHMWFGINTHSSTQGFKFYGDTTLIGRIDGMGSSDWEGQGRFKGWYTTGAGSAAELGVSAGGALFVGFNRTDSVYIPVTLIGGRGTVRKRIFLDQVGYQFSDLINAGLLGTDASGYLVDKSAAYVTTTGNGYIQNQNAVAQASTNFWIDGLARSQRYITYLGTSAVGTLHYTMYSNNKARWSIGLQTTESGSTGGSDFSVYRFDSSGTTIDRPFAITRATGVAQFKQVPTVNTDPILTAATHTGGTNTTFFNAPSGATVPAVITGDAFGHLKTISTRTLTPGDISAAPSNIPLATVLANGNTANSNITLGQTASTNPYGLATNRLIGAIGIAGTFGTISVGGNNGGAGLSTSDGANANRILVVTNTGGAPYFSKNAGTSWDSLWHSGNHVPGAAFTPVLTGANVLASITTNTAGHVTALTTRVLTPADIHAAPETGSTAYAPATGSTSYAQASGSNNYIQNNTSSTQNASFTINGTASFKTQAYTGSIYQNQVTSNYRSGMYVQSTASINNVLTGAKSNGFMWRWLSVDSGALDYTTDVNEKMRLTFDGRLGIGTIAPGTTLEVAGVAAVSGSANAFMWSDRTLAGNNKWQWYSSGGSTYLFDGLNQVNRMAVSNAGNVAIGKDAATAGYKLDVNGYVQSTGFYQASLRSLKKDIKPFTASATKILDSAQVRTFVYKADSSNVTHIGFIADEVPDAMASPQRQGVDQANTTALLVKALQETTARLDAMEKRVAELEKKLKEKK